MLEMSAVRRTGTSLGRTDVNDECPSQKCTTSEHWQPGVFSSPTSVPRNGGKLALKPMMGHRRKYVSKSSAQSTREFHRDACQNVERSSAVWFSPKRRDESTRPLGQELQTN